MVVLQEGSNIPGQKAGAGADRAAVGKKIVDSAMRDMDIGYVLRVHAPTGRPRNAGSCPDVSGPQLSFRCPQPGQSKTFWG